MNKRKLLAGPYLIWAVGFIILPLLMIIYYGLTSPDGGFTLENLLAIGDPIHYKALGQSLLIALHCESLQVVPSPVELPEGSKTIESGERSTEEEETLY